MTAPCFVVRVRDTRGTFLEGALKKLWLLLLSSEHGPLALPLCLRIKKKKSGQEKSKIKSEF